MTIEEIQDAFRFDMDMILFDPFSGESESEEWYLERNKRNGNEMNVVTYLAKKEAIDKLEELKDLRKWREWEEKSSDKYYNKGIDKCIEIVKFHENEYDGIFWALRELEELKEGGENENIFERKQSI